MRVFDVILYLTLDQNVFLSLLHIRNSYYNKYYVIYANNIRAISNITYHGDVWLDYVKKVYLRYN